jgi:hypothetical protein
MIALNRAIRKWQRNRNRSKALLGLVHSLTDIQRQGLYTKTMTVELSRKLATHETGVLDRIPVFLRGLKWNHSVAAEDILNLVKGDSSSGAISLYLNHYEYLSEMPKIRMSIDRFVSGTLVEQYNLDEWRLPVERERKVIDLILRLRDENRPTGDWLVPYILTNPDKADRVIDVLMKRDVNSAQAMEVLLDDEVPMAMQEGAL